MKLKPIEWRQDPENERVYAFGYLPGVKDYVLSASWNSNYGQWIIHWYGKEIARADNLRTAKRAAESALTEFFDSIIEKG